MSARAQILAAARRALANHGELPAIPRSYRGAGTAAGDDLASTPARFEQCVRECGARVSHATPATVATTIDRIAAKHGAARLVRPYGLELQLPGTALVPDGGLSPAELDEVDGVVTGCAAAIANTGTIILDGGAICGRRAISLIPDLHICLVKAAQIVVHVPDAVALIKERALTTSPLTFVSGPSATSDIGFERVEGVHGPRRLEVVIVAELQ